MYDFIFFFVILSMQLSYNLDRINLIHARQLKCFILCQDLYVLHKETYILLDFSTHGGDNIMTGVDQDNIFEPRHEKTCLRGFRPARRKQGFTTTIRCLLSLANFS